MEVGVLDVDYDNDNDNEDRRIVEISAFVH